MWPKETTGSVNDNGQTTDVIDFKKCIISFFLFFVGAIRKCSRGALFRLIWRQLSSVPELHLHLHWIAAVFVGCGIIWDYDYMRHWKKKVEMGKTDGWGLVRTCSPGRCPGRVLNGYSMGTNVNTPFFQVPAPEYHHVISYKTSKVCLLLRRFVCHTEASTKPVLLVTTSKARFPLPPSFAHTRRL